MGLLATNTAGRLEECVASGDTAGAEPLGLPRMPLRDALKAAPTGVSLPRLDGEAGKTGDSATMGAMSCRRAAGTKRRLELPPAAPGRDAARPGRPLPALLSAPVAAWGCAVVGPKRSLAACAALAPAAVEGLPTEAASRSTSEVPTAPRPGRWEATRRMRDGAALGDRELSGSKTDSGDSDSAVAPHAGEAVTTKEAPSSLLIP